MMKKYIQKFSVTYSYPVHFTKDMFNPKNMVLKNTIASCTGPESQVMVFIDSGVIKAQPGITAKISKYLKSMTCKPVVIPGGERAKTAGVAEEVLKRLSANRMCRHSCVIAIGGGSVLDVTGYASSIYHRGLRLIRVPTTVLSQNDAGIGVKNAINGEESKNLIGTFAPPAAVINDSEFLKTLKTADWTGGISEAFKIALIKDRPLFTWLCRNAGRLGKRDISAMEHLVHRCAVLHLEHIRRSGDPFETGSSRPLDYGHWSAHGLEVLTSGRLAHGQAVSIGIALDSCYAMLKGFISEQDMQSLITGLTTCGLPVWDPILKSEATFKFLTVKALDSFRIHMGGELTLAMPKPLGSLTEIDSIDPRMLKESLALLQFLSLTVKG